MIQARIHGGKQVVPHRT